MKSIHSSRSLTSSTLGGQPFALNAATPRPQVSEADLESTLERLEWLSRILDEAITIPGTSIRIGWDAVLGLIPVVGDGTTTIISTYYLWEANRLGARKRALLKMLGNVGIDFVAGAIPLVGDLVDVTWRANRRNLNVLVQELERQGRLAPDSHLLQRLRKSREAPPPQGKFRNYQSRPFMLP